VRCTVRRKLMSNDLDEDITGDCDSFLRETGLEFLPITDLLDVLGIRAFFASLPIEVFKLREVLPLLDQRPQRRRILPHTIPTSGRIA